MPKKSLKITMIFMLFSFFEKKNHLAIYIKEYVKAKARRIMETQIFHHAKI
jgi:hypothetical protein